MTEAASFSIPSSLVDLERAPYQLLPYPQDFDDDNEAARAESFDNLIDLIETSNQVLSSSTMALFESEDEEEEVWNDEDRMQALYTLVRKSSSIAAHTKRRLVEALCKALQNLLQLLTKASEVNQEFRTALQYHVYMLFSVMNFTESELKGQSSVSNGRGDGANATAERDTLRATCAQTMLCAAKSMAKFKAHLWQRGVADEATILLPCRIAYIMLENATGVLARKSSCAEEALNMLSTTIDAYDALASTTCPVLIDLLHEHEHMAPLVAQLCNKTTDNRITIELLREIGRLELLDSAAKASGVRNLAPFISELAQCRPVVLLNNISLVVKHFSSEPYPIRSALVTALGHLIVYIGSLSLTTTTTAPTTDNETTANTDYTKARDSFMDLLVERVLDVSSFTRAAACKAWISIVVHKALPMDRFLQVTALAADRLRDRTVMVRRNSMQLLKTLLETNPFIGSLDPKPYKDKVAETLITIHENMPTAVGEALEAACDQAGDDEEEVEKLKQAAAKATIAEVESFDDTQQEESDANLVTAVKAFSFAQSALSFIDQFEDAIQACEGMLLSSTKSDVTEALRFFVRARQFKLPCAVRGMKSALALCWSDEKAIQDEVLESFIEVFIAVPGSNGKECLPENKIAHNLLVLVGRATVSELASIEEALGRLVKEERIPPDVFLILWSIASKAPGEARSTALLILAMGASTDRSIIDSPSRLRLLLDSGLGDYTEDARAWNIVRSAATALERVRINDMDPSSAKALVLEQIVERLEVIIRGDWCNDDANCADCLSWFSAAEKCIDALFCVATEPESVCAEILNAMLPLIFDLDSEEDSSTCHSLQLARFFFVLGHVSLKLLVTTEFIASAIRRANAKKSLSKQEKADKEATGGEDGDALEDELDVAAAIEAENERRFQEIVEQEILGRALISKFAPLVMMVVKNDGGAYKSDILRQCATLALCKFMLVSKSFCADYLPLLFTALANSPEDDKFLRANIVVALGDHAFRFPNELEPYSSRLYACLRDPHTRVRRHALMVMTHLILNDMVKVKGQVCEVALCLCDEDARMQDMCRLLFFELAKRTNNPIYNLLPDIISRLGQQSVKKDDFRSIMSFLLGFIKKDRQNEMLVEKLCNRFSKSDSMHEKAHLAFCLSQLKMSEKSVKYLTDNFRKYKDALFDDEVQKSFASIVTKAKKSAKPEMKEALLEWEEKLNACGELGKENQVAGKRAERARAKAKRRTKQTGTHTKATRSSQAELESEIVA